MDVWFLCSAYLSRPIMPRGYRICQPLLVGFVDCLGRDTVDDEEGAVAADVIMNRSLLPRKPADRYEFIELGFLDHIPLVSVIGIADAFLEGCQVDLEILQLMV